MWSWGNNAHGQLGLKDTTNRFSPTPISSLDHLLISQISCGAEHSAIVAGIFPFFSFYMYHNYSFSTSLTLNFLFFGGF